MTDMAMVGRMPLSIRIWRALGYGLNGAVEMTDWRTKEDSRYAPGAIVTDVLITVSFVDRLRLLFSGKARLEISTKTDVLVEHSESRSAFGVMWPGYKLTIGSVS